MDFKENKDALNRDLEQFILTLNELLPRYTHLLSKQSLDKIEVTELGDIEHYLMEVNAKISEIKVTLEQDLFGNSLDTYFKIKREAFSGDKIAHRKYLRMREVIEDVIIGGNTFLMN